MDATTIKKIGKYDVIGELGHGGMGVVYLAEDKRIGRKVAIKTLTEGYTGQPDMLERFYREAQAGILQHPNIVTVFDLGDQDGIPFIVMDYVPGQALNQILASGKQFPLIQKLSVIEQVCSALDYAHQNGVIHRDIKPANIMVEPNGRAKLVDFGIAHIKKTDDFTALTITGNVIGTLYYIAPERLNGQPYDGRSDIFATGVLLYQLITGHLPFAGEDSSVLNKIVNSPHPPLKNYLSNYPLELDAILDRALAKDPEDRYATAEDFAADLHSVGEGLKKGLVAGLFEDAKRLKDEGLLGRAKELLQEVLRIESSHTGARQILVDVQRGLEVQGRAERVRQLVEQSEEHLFSDRFTDAIKALEQAVKLDPQSPTLQTRLETARTKKTVADQIVRDLAEVEERRSRQDYTGALNVLEKARVLDPNNSRVQATYATVKKQVQLAAQRGRVRELLENARQELVARRFTSAISILTEVQGIDPSTPELEALRDKAVKGKEQEDRRRVLDEIQRRVTEFLSADNYAPAAELLNRALDRLPNEPLLHRLKAEVDADVRKVETRRQVDAAITHARELFATSPQEALAALQKAIEELPGEERLLDYERSLRAQMDVARTERVRSETLAKASALLDRSQFDKAIGVLESYHLEFGSDSDVDGLLEFAKSQQRRTRIDSLMTEARSLVRQERLDDAAQMLESGISETGDPSLSKLLQEVREKQAAALGKVELLQKRVVLLRERGELDEAIQTLQSHLVEAPGNKRAQDLLTAIQAERERKQVVSQAVAAAREALNRRDLSAGWESLQTIQRAYGESPELTRATQEFQSARAAIAQEEVGKSIELARAALLKNDPEAALAALKASMAMVEFADSARQSEWRAIGQRAKEAQRRPTGTTSVGAVLDDPLASDATPKRSKTVVWVVAGAVLAVVAVLVFFLRPHPKRSDVAQKTQIRIVAKLPSGEVVPDAQVSIDGSAQGVTNEKGEALLPVNPGSRILLVTKDGYDPYHDTVEVGKGDKYPEPVTLTKAVPHPGSLVATGNSPEFKIFVNGTDRGKFTNGKPLRLAAGSYTIHYSAPGYTDSAEKSIVIAQDKDTSDTFNLTPVTPTSATINEFTASPDTVGDEGGPVTLRWRTTGASKVSIGDETVPLKGSKTVQVSKETPFEIVAVGGDRKSVNKEFTVRVKHGVPTITRFVANPSTAKPGDTITLQWETVKAAGVSIQGVGSKRPSGTANVVIAENASDQVTYQLSATGEGGTVTSTTSVTIKPLPKPASIGNFVVDPPSVKAGEQVTLQWATRDAKAVSIQGIGKVELSGSRQVSVAKDTTFVLVATGEDGKEVRSEPRKVIIETPKATGPDRAALEQALTDMQSIFSQASGKKGNDCKTVLSNLPASKSLLAGLQQWCGGSTFAGRYVCSGSPSGGDREATWSCTEIVSIGGQSPVNYTNSTFSFTKAADGGWRVTKWDWRQ